MNSPTNVVQQCQENDELFDDVSALFGSSKSQRPPMLFNKLDKCESNKANSQMLPIGVSSKKQRLLKVINKSWNHSVSTESQVTQSSSLDDKEEQHRSKTKGYKKIPRDLAEGQLFVMDSLLITFDDSSDIHMTSSSMSDRHTELI